MGVYVSCKDDSGYSALHWASLYGHIDVRSPNFLLCSLELFDVMKWGHCNDVLYFSLSRQGPFTLAYWSHAVHIHDCDLTHTKAGELDSLKAMIFSASEIWITRTWLRWFQCWKSNGLLGMVSELYFVLFGSFIESKVKWAWEEARWWGHFWVQGRVMGSA